jgi:CBS-domain-containing membrane protein
VALDTFLTNLAQGKRGQKKAMTIPHYAPTLLESGLLAQRAQLQPTDSALFAFTDFTVEHSVTVEEERCIDEALKDMVRNGVRALRVTRDHRVTGLITSYDIQGERPLQFLQNSTFTCHQDICVGRIMTPLHRWPAIKETALRRLTAAELLQSLYEDGPTHLLVVEQGPERATFVRGIVSRSWLVRQLSEKPFIEGLGMQS